MSYIVCAPSIEQYSPFSSALSIRIGIGNLGLSSTRQYSVWAKRLELNFPQRDLIQECIEIVKAGKFEIAVNIILSEVYEHSRIFAQVFGKTLSDKIDIPQLIDELKTEGVIDEKNWNRLATLLMVIDGIDVEFHEDGGEITLKDIENAHEYIRILNYIMEENGIYFSSSAYSFINAFSKISIVSVDEELCVTKISEFLGLSMQGTSNTIESFSDNPTNSQLSV